MTDREDVVYSRANELFADCGRGLFFLFLMSVSRMRNFLFADA